MIAIAIHATIVITALEHAARTDLGRGLCQPCGGFRPATSADTLIRPCTQTGVAGVTGAVVVAPPGGNVTRTR